MSDNAQIELFHKTRNTPVPYLKMHHFVTEMSTCAKWCIVGYLCNALWDLWDGSIAEDTDKLLMSCQLTLKYDYLY